MYRAMGAGVAFAFALRLAALIVAFPLAFGGLAKANPLMPDEPGDVHFGHYVSMSGGTVIASGTGAYGNPGGEDPGAYVFLGLHTPSNSPIYHDFKLFYDEHNTTFGNGVAVSGNTALVTDSAATFGLYGEGGTRAGLVYVFRDLDQPSPYGDRKRFDSILHASDPQAWAQFGASVGMSGDNAIVGANNAASIVGGEFRNGAAYVFRDVSTHTNIFNSEDIKLVANDDHPNANFGISVAMSGNAAVVGATGAATGYETAGQFASGAAYVFRDLDDTSKDGTTVQADYKLAALDIGASVQGFGNAVAVDGDMAIVGAFRTTIPDASTNQLPQILLGEEPEDLQPEGGIQWAGSAYVYRNINDPSKSGTVTQDITLRASDAAEGDLFGVSVALAGDTALVGAGFAGEGKGAAYLYLGLDNVPERFLVYEDVKITASDATDLTRFGIAVAMDRDNPDNFVISTYGPGDHGGQRAYVGSVASLTTLDEGNAIRHDKHISGISFESRTNWIIGENTANNHVVLGEGDTAVITHATLNLIGSEMREPMPLGNGLNTSHDDMVDDTAGLAISERTRPGEFSEMALYIGKNAHSNDNSLTVHGSVITNAVYVGDVGNTGNLLDISATGSVLTKDFALDLNSSVNIDGTLDITRTLFAVLHSDGLGTYTFTQFGAATGAINFGEDMTLAMRIHGLTEEDIGETFTIVTHGLALNESLLLHHGATYTSGGYVFDVLAPGDGTFALQLQAIPEPSTWLLLGAGAAVVVVFRRRRKKNLVDRE